MKLENIVPWGRNLEEYQKMFLLSASNLKSKILGCGDGPSSFNQELNIKGIKHISVDPIYQFSKKEIQQRIEDTSIIVSEQLRLNKADFIWHDIFPITTFFYTNKNKAKSLFRTLKLTYILKNPLNFLASAWILDAET